MSLKEYILNQELLNISPSIEEFFKNTCKKNRCDRIAILEPFENRLYEVVGVYCRLLKFTIKCPDKTCFYDPDPMELLKYKMPFKTYGRDSCPPNPIEIIDFFIEEKKWDVESQKKFIKNQNIKINWDWYEDYKLVRSIIDNSSLTNLNEVNLLRISKVLKNLCEELGILYEVKEVKI